jgi:hypothetical protein
MKALIITVVVILLVIFLGGAVPLGGASLFEHIDSVLGVNALMSVHYATFWLLYRGEADTGSGITRTKKDIEQFEKAPVGFDKHKTYKKLDEAAR